MGEETSFWNLRPREILNTKKIEVYWIGGGVGGPEVIEIPFGVSSTPGAPVEVKEKTWELAEIAKEILAPYVLGFLEPLVPKVALSLYIDPEKGAAFVSASSIPEKEGEFGQTLAVVKYQNGNMVGYSIKEELVISEMGRVFKIKKVEEEGKGITFAVVSGVNELGVKVSRFPFWPKQELNLVSGEWGRVDWQGLLEERGKI